jgi:rod shape-determining protein MreC
VPVAARTISRGDIVLLAVSLVLAITALELSERVRDPITASLRRSLLAPLVGLQHDAELTRLAWRARETRTLVADSAAVRSLELPAVRNENDRLRKMLGLGQRLRWGFVPAEVLQGRGVMEEFAVTLSAGSGAGVRPFSPLVAPEGLVGMVRSVDPSMSTAVLWAHPDFRASAMSVDGGVFGIVASHGGADPEQYLLEMRGVPMRATIAPGTLIVTSGLGGTFPRGIPVGVILSEIRTNELWARTYLLRPAVSPADLSSVVVLLQDRTRAGVEPIWRGTKGDSSLSGDSGIVATPMADPAVVAAREKVIADSAQAADSARRRRRFRRDSIAAAARAESAAVAPPRVDSAPPRNP